MSVLRVQNSLRQSLDTMVVCGTLGFPTLSPKVFIKSPMARFYHLLCSVDEESSRSRQRARTRILHHLLGFPGKAANRKLSPG